MCVRQVIHSCSDACDTNGHLSLVLMNQRYRLMHTSIIYILKPICHPCFVKDERETPKHSAGIYLWLSHENDGYEQKFKACV